MAADDVRTHPLMMILFYFYFKKTCRLNQRSRFIACQLFSPSLQKKSESEASVKTWKKREKGMPFRRQRQTAARQRLDGSVAVAACIT
jgi:hypothetical protein